VIGVGEENAPKSMPLDDEALLDQGVMANEGPTTGDDAESGRLGDSESKYPSLRVTEAPTVVEENKL
jgi:hypothetical protein